MAVDIIGGREMSDNTKRGTFYKITDVQQNFLSWLVYQHWPPLEHLEINKILDTQWYNGMQKIELNRLRTEHMDEFIEFKNRKSKK